MWRISRIKLRDFKVYEGEYSLPLSPITAVVGRIGAGKSSLLQAIEFALFGKELEVREKIARMADLINLNSSLAQVELEMVEGDRRALIRRRLNRRGATSLELELDGVKYSGEEAEERLRALAGIGDEDFDRVVYISHYALEDFIHGDRQRRAAIMDKLLEIDLLDYTEKLLNQYIKLIMNNIEKIRVKLSYYEQYKDVFEKYGGVSRARSAKESLEKELGELNRRESALLDKYKGAVAERGKYLDKLLGMRSKIEEYFRVKSELELLEGEGVEAFADLRPLEELRDRFLGVLSEFEHIVGSDLIESLSKSADPSKLAELMQEAYVKLERISSDLEREEERLAAQIREVEARANEEEAASARLRAQLSQLEALYAKFKELEGKYGALGALKAKVESLKSAVEDLERRLAYASSLRYLLRYILEAGLEECPICGAKLDRAAVAKRAEDVESMYSSQLKELTEKRAALEELEEAYREMTSLSQAVGEYLKVKESLERLEAELGRLRAKADQASKALAQLRRRREALSRFLAEVNRETIDEVVRRYNRALRIAQLRERIELIERELSNAGLSRSVLEAEEELSKLSEELDRVRRRKAELYEELNRLAEALSKVDVDVEPLRARLGKLSSAYDRLLGVANKLGVIKANVRNRIIAEIREEVLGVFRQIYPYGDIVGLELAAEEKGYEITARLSDGNAIGVSKLSDGQRLAVALSLVIAIRNAIGLRLGFILLDDPLPYVDPNVRAALAGLIAALSRQYQVVVATQTMELAEEIARQGVGVGVVEIRREGGRPDVELKLLAAPAGGSLKTKDIRPD
nr:MAG: chromosome segregation protein SMC [Thermoproteus sp. AZ2]